MKRRDYILKCRELSGDCSKKQEAVEALLKDDPDLSEDGAYDKYWDLQNEAATAAIAWQQFSSEHRGRLTD